MPTLLIHLYVSLWWVPGGMLAVAKAACFGQSAPRVPQSMALGRWQDPSWFRPNALCVLRLPRNNCSTPSLDWLTLRLLRRARDGVSSADGHVTSNVRWPVGFSPWRPVSESNSADSVRVNPARCTCAISRVCRWSKTLEEMLRRAAATPRAATVADFPVVCREYAEAWSILTE